MQAERQTEAIAFLTDPRTHAGAAAGIEVIETQGSVVVLAGARAYKLKRPVALASIDLATAEQRLILCERVVELNRRSAPDLYLGVRRITRAPDGHLAFDGDGQLVEAVIEMVRFDQNGLFDRMAVRGALTPALLTELATVVARLHEAAPVELAGSGADTIASVIALNGRALAGTALFAPADVERVNRAFRNALAQAGPSLGRRHRLGKVRHCHGDLRLGNICLFEGHPVPFDCLEFDDAMATVDVLHDLALLLVDLWQRRLKSGANLVFNRYLDAVDESDGLVLVPFLMAVHAAVRARVSAARAADAGAAANVVTLGDDAVAHFRLAEALLRPAPPRLVAIGGFSGAGKSTVSAAIAEAIGTPPGARVLSSDRIRKRMGGVAPTTPLPAAAYRREVSRAVYETLGHEAEYLLALGHGVIVDATFRRPEERAHIEDIAAAVDVPFTGVWLELAPEALVTRLEGRGPDPSDATAKEVSHQLSQFGGPVKWNKVAADGSIAAVVGRVLKVIGRG